MHPDAAKQRAPFVLTPIGTPIHRWHLCSSHSLFLLTGSAFTNGLDGAKNSKVLLLQSFEVIVELLVPRVQDADLERQCRRGNNEVGDGNGPGEEHRG